MRWNAKTLGMTLMLLAACTASAGWASSLNGEIKLGGIFKDETVGDVSAMPETFNIYEGFSFSRLKLDGQAGRKNFFTLDLNEVNQKSGRGLFGYRVPDLLNLTLRYDQHRQIYDAAGDVTSRRKNMRGSFVLTPSKTWRISADLGDQRKSGERMAYPQGTDSFLGNGYDYKLFTGRFEAEARKDSRAAAVGYEFSDYKDEDLSVAARQGGVFSLRLSGNDYFVPTHLSHYLRASYGKQEMTEVDTDYEMGTFQYLGTVKPARDWQFKYRFFASRVDDNSTGLQTDNLRNDFDLVWYNAIGNLFGGYGFVTNDDDRTLTDYNVYRVGGTFNYEQWVKARISYASNQKQDQEEKTLLKDMEASRFKASIQGSPTTDLTLGVAYVDRQRDFPLIDVTATGQRWSAFGRLVYPGWGAVNLDYSYSDEEYIDRVASFQADNSTVTGRIDFEYIKDLRLSFGASYLDIGKDLNIEKSILSFEAQYDFLKDYFVEAKYNCYNYDDYILLDRYYTANVVWLNFGYKLAIN